jgi:phosphoglycerate dehydrogenase-like enzyme
VRDILAQALPHDEVVIIPEDELRESDVKVDVLVPRGAVVDAAVMDATRPSMIQQFGVGLQGVDLEAAAQRNIPVAHIPGGDSGNAVAVSEIALLHTLGLLRRYPEARRMVAQGRVGEPVGSMLAGKTVTVVGVGAIGGAVIDRLHAFGAKTIGVGRRDYTASAALAQLSRDDYYRFDARLEALSRSKVVIICCPLTEQTRGLIGQPELAAMPSGGYVVNVGRGPVIDYDALLDALRSGHLAGAGLDVTWEEPIDPDDALLRENVLLTPHIGGVTVESGSAMAHVFVANVQNLRAGRPIAHRAA